MTTSHTPGKRVCVVVATSHRGIFHGFAEPAAVDGGASAITLTRARIRLRYRNPDGVVTGFTGLASVPPTPDCRIGEEAPRITLRDVTAVMVATADVLKAIYPRAAEVPHDV